LSPHALEAMSEQSGFIATLLPLLPKAKFRRKLLTLTPLSLSTFVVLILCLKGVRGQSLIPSTPSSLCGTNTTQGVCLTVPQHNCSEIRECHKCILYNNITRCGWCDYGSGSGLGQCMEGGDAGPSVVENSSHPKSELCEKENWYFNSCPSCNCNGHSTCLLGTSECRQPCNNLTEGSHCQWCQPTYWGNAINGGMCNPCKCNPYHSYHLCNRETGKCHCTTKGVIGDACDRCDEPNHYLMIEGSCFYNLTIDFQYTFNLSKNDDKYLYRINFMTVPMKTDVDVDFTISCSRTALVNISIGSNTLPIRQLYDLLECGSFKLRFPHDEHLFGAASPASTTFYVNVFRFETPFILQISFSQHRTLDLLQFFVTFSSCFLTLLIISAILWKIKQKYDMYRRRQQLFLELQNMASRPFAGITLEVEKELEAKANEPFISSKNNPTPIALEPTATGKAAVLSVIVRLPTAGTGSIPLGTTGLAIASALVSLDPRLVRESRVETNNSSSCKHCVSVNTKCISPETGTPGVL